MANPLASRAFIGIALVGVLACVYLQASGASTLVAQQLLHQSPPQLMAGPAPAPVLSGQLLPPTPLFVSNPFDWRVRLEPPLPLQVGLSSEAPNELAPVHPLRAATCVDISVSIVTQSSNPAWSVGVMKTTSEAEAVPRHWGDRIGDYEVAYIGYNHLRASPAVWLTHPTGLCQSLLFEGEQRPKTSAGKTPDAPPVPAQKSRASRRNSLPPEIANGITKVSETQVAVERAVVDQVLQDPSAFMSSARIVPTKSNGAQTPMIRLVGVQPGSLLSALNLANGDTLSRINGYDLGNVEQATMAYARLRSATSLTLDVIRAGKPVTLEVTIR